MRTLAVIALLLAAAIPASARLWKPTPPQQIADYLSITHSKGDGNVAILWVASPLAAEAVKPMAEKYVILSVIRTRRGADGVTTWDDVQGVHVRDGAGNALKEVPSDQIPPLLMGVIAGAEAATRQTSQGRSKIYWGVYEAGSINACQHGKLVVNFEAEDYSYDTPIPGCP